jgi:transcription initiation factor TFIIH subunit 4
MDLVDVLSFLFMLSTMELGRVSNSPSILLPKLKVHQEYSTSKLTRTQVAMLDDLRDYGLIWMRKVSCRPTPPYQEVYPLF